MLRLLEWSVFTYFVNTNTFQNEIDVGQLIRQVTQLSVIVFLLYCIDVRVTIFKIFILVI